MPPSISVIAAIYWLSLESNEKTASDTLLDDVLEVAKILSSPCPNSANLFAPSLYIVYE